MIKLSVCELAIFNFILTFKIHESKLKTHLHFSGLIGFQISTFPDFQVKINVSKAKTYLHMCIYVQSKGSFAYHHSSTVQRFHSSTFPEYHVKIRTSELTEISHISTFQGYSKVINVMCNTFYCDGVFCALLPQVKVVKYQRKSSRIVFSINKKVSKLFC